MAYHQLASLIRGCAAATNDREDEKHEELSEEGKHAFAFLMRLNDSHTFRVTFLSWLNPNMNEERIAVYDAVHAWPSIPITSVYHDEKMYRIFCFVSRFKPTVAIEVIVSFTKYVHGTAHDTPIVS